MDKLRHFVCILSNRTPQLVIRQLYVPHVCPRRTLRSMILPGWG
jgi:hypothetical protein